MSVLGLGSTFLATIANREPSNNMSKKKKKKNKRVIQNIHVHIKDNVRSDAASKRDKKYSR
jgi:hypothetical protein